MVLWLFLLVMITPPLHATTVPVKLGSTTVLIQRQQYGKGKSFVHLHQNERTALKAAKKVVKSQGGSVLTLVHKGGRNIIFRLNRQRYEFDPNRIFTDTGIKKTLTQHGAYSKRAHAEVKYLALRIKKLLPRTKVIAVHNNQFYSLKSYLPGHSLARDAKAYHVNRQRSYRNFYVLTQRKEFLRLKRLKFNTVLQSSRARDDGSLSKYFSQGNYVNVEAGYNQLHAQVHMLKKA